MATNICISKCRVLLRFDLTRFGLRIMPNLQQLNSESGLWTYREKRRYCTTGSLNEPYEDGDRQVSEVSVKYIQGLPHITVPLPSRNEKCRFALKPVSHSVGDLLHMLRAEDRGIDRAAVLNNEGVRIASTCSIESLMDEPFWLYINDKQYKVTPPKREKISLEELDKLGDVRALVAQLYEALHVGEHHVKKEKELLERLEELKYQISPLELEKNELDAKSIRRTNLMTWVGLGLMSVQFGILARLTWWEYSWDIMEPVTYFVTYGTAMAAYAYFCITKQEYNYPDVRDRQYLITIHKRAKKKGFDFLTYNNLKRQIADLEHDLRRLRDPLNLQMPSSSSDQSGRKYLQSSTGSNSSKEAVTSTDNIVSTSSRSSSKLDISKIINVASKKLKK